MLEDPIKLFAELENNLVSMAIEKENNLLNISFQDEVKSFFPECHFKDEDYTDELEENCFFKNLPKEFITSLSLNDLNNLYQHQSGSTNSFESDDSFQGYQLPTKFKNYSIANNKIIMEDDHRTMIVIRNIPRKYTPRALFDEICVNFYGKFNYFYLPYNSKSKQNNGYALLNFTSPLHIISFYEFYYKQLFKKFQQKDKRKLDIFYSKFTFNGTIKVDPYANDNIVIPLKYLKLFKSIFSRSVCIVKEKNIYNEGYCIVKSLGKRFI